MPSSPNSTHSPDLRHSYASVAVSTGEDLKTVAGLLGHAELETTKGYAHLAVAPIQAAAGRVSGHLAKTLTPAAPVEPMRSRSYKIAKPRRRKNPKAIDSRNDLKPSRMAKPKAEKATTSPAAKAANAWRAYNHAEGLAKSDLRMARRMRKRHEHLLATAFLLPDIVRDDGQPTGETVLVAQPFKDPLRRVTLLLMNALIVQKDLIDDPHKRIQLGANRRTLATVSRRHGELQDFRYRLTINPKLTSGLASAHTIDMAGATHPVPQNTSPPFALSHQASKWRIFNPRRSDHPTASVVQFRSGF